MITDTEKEKSLPLADPELKMFTLFFRKFATTTARLVFIHVCNTAIAALRNIFISPVKCVALTCLNVKLPHAILIDKECLIVISGLVFF